MKDFYIKFLYLLDKNDRINFIKFLLLLFFGGILSLLGISIIIPFVNLLINPEYIQKIAFIKQTHLSYEQILGVIIALLILSFWLKNIASFVILKKQTAFLGSIIAKIQKKLFSCYLHSPYDYHIKRNSPELINNINVEIGVLFNEVIIQLGTLLNEGMTSLIIIVALLYINPTFSLIVVSAIVLTAFFFIKKIRNIISYYGELRSKSDMQLTQSLMQGLGGIKETKLYQKEHYFINQVNHYADSIAKADSFASVFQQIPRYLVETILVTVVLALMFFFIKLGYTTAQMLVIISVFGIAALQLLPSMNRFLQSLAKIKYGYVALDKIYHELNFHDQLTAQTLHQHSVKLPSLTFSKEIHLKAVSFYYEGKQVLNNINLVMHKGKKIAFVGPSGAGKTTLLNIILGILMPSQGELCVDDTRITSHNICAWYNHFGYIPENIYIYNSNIRENIAFGVPAEDINDAQVWHCLEMASLSNFVKEKCPHGLATLVGENGINLSGGQRQRIGIARALYHEPTILVMDEATAALDNQTEYTITQSLVKAVQGRTLMTIAHRLSTIKDYDEIHMMLNGQIIASGDYHSLLETCEAFRQMAKVE